MNSARPVTDIFREIRNGDMVQEISQELRDLIPDVLEAGKAGKINITITLTPPKKSTGHLHIDDKIKVTNPLNPPSTLFFLDQHNNLIRHDPKQTNLDLSDASNISGDSKPAIHIGGDKIDPDTGEVLENESSAS